MITKSGIINMPYKDPLKRAECNKKCKRKNYLKNREAIIKRVNNARKLRRNREKLEKQKMFLMDEENINKRKMFLESKGIFI